MDSLLLGVAILLFFAVFLAAEGLLYWWDSTRGPEARRISKRLRAMSAGGNLDAASASLLKQRLLSDIPLMQRFLLQLPRAATLDRLLVQSGSNVTVSSFLATSTLLFMAGTLVCLVLRIPFWIAVIIGVVLATLPFEIMMIRRARRLKRFEYQLPEALDLVGRALRAGHSFSSSLQMAGNELPDPIGEELRQVFDEINFGVAVPTALQNLVARIPSTDLGFFAISVMIQRETGGNLAEVLDKISMIIRERLKLFGKVRTLSAEGRISALILSLLPFVTAAMMFVVNPSFMSILWTDSIGQRLLAAGLVMMFLGIIWMRKIIQIRV